MERQPITREGYEKLREEIRRLEDVELPAIVERIADARAEGDLRENAEYHGQREEQGRMMARVAQMKAKLASCFVVEKSEMPKGIVTFGATVTVKNITFDEEETYEFVGPGEEDYDGAIMKILTTSPIAKALMGKKVGDTTEVALPRGVNKMEVVKIADHSS